MYLVIETKTLNQEFTHFVNLNNNELENDLKSTIKMIIARKEQITKVYKSKDQITNW